MSLCLLFGGVALQAPPAEATITTLCTGYAGCAKAGMGSDGYSSASGTMYWRMYSGHNCTNYAAYRMVRSGLANERPWVGGGNATYWGQYMSDITDDVPSVGAVAWWRAGVYPAGSAGHVAYVEKVISSNEIIISQDSWGGDFSWARITRDSRGWPSGFIHFNDVAIRDVERPVISGDLEVGSTLTATAGTWTPTGVTTTFQWRSGGEPIAGATASTFTIPPSLLGQRLNVRVTASKAGFPSETAGAGRTARVQPGDIDAEARPAVSGDPVVDSPLTVDTGAWAPEPDSVTVQWYADGEPVEGADGTTYAPGPDVLRKQLSVEVTAHKKGYADESRSSAPTDEVAKADFAAVDTPEITDIPRLGELLTVETGSASPSGELAVQWFRDGDRIDGATGTTYTPTLEDLGNPLTVRTRWTRDGYRKQALVSEPTRDVKAVPVVRVRDDVQRDEVLFTVRARAEGTDPVPAVVRLRHLGKVVDEVALVDGEGVVRISGLRPGMRQVRIVVRGTETTARFVEVHEFEVP